MIPLPTRAQLTSFGVVLLCIGLVLACFSGNWVYLGSPLPFDRPFVLGGLLVILIANPPKPPFTALLVLGGLVIVTVLVSIVAAGGVSQDGLYAGLDQLVIPYGMLVAGLQLSATGFRRRAVLVTISLIGFYCAYLAVVETLGLHALVFPGYINDPDLGLHYGRARGPFLESVADGLVLSYAFVTSSMLFASARTIFGRVVAGLGAALCFGGVILTLTRAVWIAVAIAGLVLFVLVPRVRRFFVGAAVAGGVLGALAFVLTPLGAAAADRSTDLSPVWDRLNTDAAAGRIIAHNPVFGVGWDNASNVIGQYVRLAPTYPVTAVSANLQPHNVLLGRAAEIGVPGFVLWLAVVVVAIVLVLLGLRRRGPLSRSWAAASIAVWVTWITAINLSPVAFALPNYLPYLLAGMAIGVQQLPVARLPRRPAAHPPAVVEQPSRDLVDA